ncbi:hypothetical protein EVAR_46786_1 [Eumeta japonica]|uniref:Nose resistant to fluoxetine protein 6 n=1 Tax=Eumeta variegata TaxID=151549 RepID=A0A4C1XG01_EUMVA|nr:hypothetical protein EVAR_46786_1 [Eumeta japonica]
MPRRPSVQVALDLPETKCTLAIRQTTVQKNLKDVQLKTNEVWDRAEWRMRTNPNEEYYQLPAVFEVQDYEKCLSQRENAFCAGAFELSSAGPSQLYDILKKYSANKRHNFNHTRIHRAMCLGPKSDCPVKDNLTESFKECIDKSMFEEYGLRADLMRFDFCRRSGEKPIIDNAGVTFCIYLTIVVVLNVIGTVYDWVLKNSNVNAKGNRWLMAFSLFDNWRRLTSISGGKETRFQNLSCFYGIKTLAMFTEQFAHVMIVICLSLPTNPRIIEEVDSEMKTATSAGRTAVQLRPELIRIHPVHLTTIGILATIFVHLNDGPLWYKQIGMRAERCREMWWHHVLFLNNFHYWADCMPQAWHLAMDFQVYLISSIIMVWILGRGLDPEYILRRLLVASLIMLFAIAYLFELQPQLLTINPE